MQLATHKPITQSNDNGLRRLRASYVGCSSPSCGVLKVSPTADQRYMGMLATRIAAADRGEFASAAEVARFLLEHSE